MIRDWSLITGRGNKTDGDGGASEVLPIQVQKHGGGGGGGAEKSISHALNLKGGAKSFGPAIFPFCSRPPPLP